MNPSISEQLAINQKSWNQVAERFFGRNPLPDWGPNAPSEEKLQLLGDLQGLKTLEIGCGSGHSIKYMLSRGVKEAWGLDFSVKQLNAARKILGSEHDQYLFQSTMEEDPGLPHHYFDIVYSDYAIGWTLDLKTTLSHIHQYLKPGGLFVFSWEHPLHNIINYQDGKIEFFHSYNEEAPKQLESWNQTPAILHFRKVSTFVNELIRAGFSVEEVIDDVVLTEETPKDPHWYSDSKANLFPTTLIIKSRKVSE